MHVQRKQFNWISARSMKVRRADLPDHKPQRKMTALKKRLMENNDGKSAQDQKNDLSPAIGLIYRTYKNKAN